MSVDPNLSVTGDSRGRIRYPSPFFDLSQQYIPPTIKELFKWVYFYCTNNSFLGPALQKIARYPVTDLVFEDSDEGLVKTWTTILSNTLQVKTFNMEVNLDLTSYGNAFVTLHYPFSRMLECQQCQNRAPWKSVQKRIDNLVIKGACNKCKFAGPMKIIDIPFKSVENMRVIRINPEYIDIKYNETTGRHTYLYSIPDRLKKQIMAGDPDILEDTPQIYIEAIKHKRKIKLSAENIFHLKNPTLAGKDMGWGLPRVANALKDLYHFYVLRRAQEAIMHEHIIPFDILFPQASGKMDPYTNTDLSSWKKQMERELANRRRDPNYKSIMPFPVGHERIGGDGKNFMLTPELDFLSKSIIGACGIPQEFVYGGSMNWTGSSISLRTLENDFLHQRSQLLQMNIWLVERIRIYLGMSSPKSCRFTDFKMADDIQRLNVMVSMASQNKLPWEDLQREFGRDPVVVKRKLEEEAAFDAQLRRSQMLKDAEAQAQAQLVMARFQAKQQSEVGGSNSDPVAIDKVTADTVRALAVRMAQASPEDRESYLERVKQLDFRFAQLLEKALENMDAGHDPVPTAQQAQEHASSQEQQANAEQQKQQQDQAQQQFDAQAQRQQQQHEMKLTHNAQTHQQKLELSKQQAKMKANMKPMPTQRPPRRQGGV
jgi:hypothetical protein